MSLCNGVFSKIKKVIMKEKWLLVFMAISFGLSSCVCLFSNFNSINTADYLANAVRIGKKNPKTKRFEFCLQYNTNNNVWFKYNYNAVSGISSLNSMNSSYMTYQSKEISEFLTYPLVYPEQSDVIDFIGITNGRENFVPLDFKPIYGDYNSSNYDCLIQDKDDVNRVMISETFANIISNAMGIIDKAELIGKNIITTNDLILTIDCIVEDQCLPNDYESNKLFIAANYLLFSTRFKDETFVFKLKDKYNTNYTLFNKLFLVGNFPKYFEPNSILSIQIVDNPWMVNEVKTIYLGKESNYLFPLFLFIFCYAILGFFANKKLIFRNDKHLFSEIKCFLFIFAFLAFYALLQLVFNGLYIFGIHINTYLSFSGVAELFIIILFFIGYCLSSFIKIPSLENKQNNTKISSDYCEVKI